MRRTLLTPHRHRRRLRHRPWIGAVLASVLTLTAVACDPPSPPPPENPPYWHPGTTVDASLHGPLVRIQWDATTGGDPVGSYQISLGTYSGTVVALVPASVRDCYISGLAANTAYTIVVTARDAQQHWSGPLVGTHGNRTTTITTSSHGGAGTNLWCHAAVDTDGDGLPNGVENDNGTYEGAGKTGTDPNVADTDHDGIPDGEEALGTGGINLRAMGARPTHKDLLLEMDWITTPTCATGFRPTAAAISELTAAYAAAPIVNPDGTNGIKLIVDYGQGGAFTGGNAITHDGSYVPWGVWDPVFHGFRAANFDPIREGVFHYAVRLYGQSNGLVLGEDFTVGDTCTASSHAVAAKTMHEMGHNLGLNHGGDTAVNLKPNYNSVMNYTYADGIDTDCNGDGDGVLDYSRGLNAPLDESDLDETVGICDDEPYDWVFDGEYHTSVQKDINQDQRINLPAPGGGTIPLTDHDDWALVESQGLAHVAI